MEATPRQCCCALQSWCALALWRPNCTCPSIDAPARLLRLPAPAPQAPPPSANGCTPSWWPCCAWCWASCSRCRAAGRRASRRCALWRRTRAPGCACCTTPATPAPGAAGGCCGGSGGGADGVCPEARRVTRHHCLVAFVYTHLRVQLGCTRCLCQADHPGPHPPAHSPCRAWPPRPPGAGAFAEPRPSPTPPHPQPSPSNPPPPPQPPRRDWAPGRQEVEQAELVVRLLAEVVPEAAGLAVWPQLHEAFTRLASRCGVGMWVGGACRGGGEGVFQILRKG